MISVLIIITTGFEQTGGLTTVMMNYYRALNKSKISIDFASINEIDIGLKEEIERCNSRYYNLGDRKKKLLQYVKNLKEIILENHYSIIHINGNSSTMIIEALIARKCGIKNIICHTHTSQSEYPIINAVLQPFFRHTYTMAIAVSKKAGDWLFGNNYIVLNNAINVKKYQYNEKSREAIRKELNIEKEFVIGTVGKLMPSKNQTYLISLFAEYYKDNPDCLLLIVGGGVLEEELKRQAYKLGISDRVLFIGMRNDIERVLQCMDVFVFTSSYEGFGMVLVEAQASGLYCIVSDAVPKETKVTSNICYLSLVDSKSIWLNKIDEVKNKPVNRRIQSIEAMESIGSHGFDINSEAIRLEQLYLNS